MAALSQSWRTAIDQAFQVTQPLFAEAWWNSINMNTPLCNISKGHGWRSHVAGESHEVDKETGNVAQQITRKFPWWTGSGWAVDRWAGRLGVKLPAA
jgi:hypothetical protein